MTFRMRPVLPIHVTKWLTLTAFALLLCWSSYYFYYKGFGRHWRALLSKEFQRFGFQIRVQRLTLDPFRGLVAKNIEIYESDRKQTVVAQVSDLSLDINYANLLQQEPALNAVDLHDAKISIPIDPLYPKAGRIRITKFQSRIYFFPGRIEVRQASGLIDGLQLQTSGTLISPAAFRFVPPLETAARPTDRTPKSFVQLLVREFEALHFSGETPRLEFTFQVDLARPESMRLEGGRLFAPAFARNGYPLRDLECQFSMENQRLDLQRVFLRDSLGEFFAKGNWNLATGEKNFQARSGLNIAALLSNDPKTPWAKELSIKGASEIEMSGSAHPDGRLELLGKLNIDHFSIRFVEFQSVRAEFSKSGESWMIANAELTHRSGALSADMLRLPGNFRMRIHSALNPTEVLVLLPPWAQHFLSEWEFEASPLLQANLSGATPEIGRLSGSGQFWLAKTKLRGSLLNSTSAAFAHDFGGWNIPFDSGSGEFALVPERIELRQFKGQIGAGQWSMQCQFGLPLNLNQGSSTIHLENVSVQTLTRQIGLLKDYQGQASGDLEFKSESGIGNGFSLTGTLGVTDARLSRVHLFAPLMTRLRPLGIHEPLQMQLTFQLNPDTLRLSSMQLLSETHTARLSGTVHPLGGIFGLAGTLEPGAVRIRGFGTLNQPSWELNPSAKR
jgi:hypothetical protein